MNSGGISSLIGIPPPTSTTTPCGGSAMTGSTSAVGMTSPSGC
jgi:hypothetical protein